MAGMSSRERALLYAKRLKESKNVNEEANKIFEEVNSLIWSKTEKPLQKEEKIKILEEVKSIIAEERKLQDGEIIVEAADNSALLDIIDLLKQKIK